MRFLHFGDKQLVMSRAHKLADKQIRILNDLPVSRKEERFLLSHAAYKIRNNEKLHTRIRDDGARMMIETRKSISDKWRIQYLKQIMLYIDMTNIDMNL